MLAGKRADVCVRGIGDPMERTFPSRVHEFVVEARGTKEMRGTHRMEKLTPCMLTDRPSRGLITRDKQKSLFLLFKGCSMS